MEPAAFGSKADEQQSGLPMVAELAAIVFDAARSIGEMRVVAGTSGTLAASRSARAR